VASGKKNVAMHAFLVSLFRGDNAKLQCRLLDCYRTSLTFTISGNIAPTAVPQCNPKLYRHYFGRLRRFGCSILTFRAFPASVVKQYSVIWSPCLYCYSRCCT